MIKSFQHIENLQTKNITGYFGVKFFTSRHEAIRILNDLNIKFLIDEPHLIEFLFEDTNAFKGRVCLGFINNAMVSATTYYQSTSMEASIIIMDAIGLKLTEMYGKTTE